MFKNQFHLSLLAFLICSLSALPMQAQKKNKKKNKKTEMAIPSDPFADMPALIDRDIFFGDPQISSGQLSPDGKYFTFIKPYNEVRNVWVKRIDEPFENAKPITADTKRPIPGYFWSRDAKHVLFVQDKSGDENFHVYAVNPEDALAGKGLPEARALTSGEGVRARIYNVPKTDPEHMFVGLNDRDPAWHDIYKVNILTGEKELILENTEKISGFEYDNQDKVRLAFKSTEDGGTEILKVENNEYTPIYNCSNEETCYTIRFDPNDQMVYLVTNKGDLDLTELMLMNPENGSTTKVEADPRNEVDFGGAFFSSVTKELVATFYNSDKTRSYFKDNKFQSDYRFLQMKFPGSEVNFGSSTEDENLWTITVNTDTDPGAVYLFNREKKTVDFLYRPRPDLPTESLSKMEAISYKSSDDLTIPAFLTLPKGKDAKNLPLVMFIHGGPWARDYWGYDSFAQFWANRGYAVLQPNFRASTGYGKAFLNAGNGEWGQLMQDDITWGVKHLVDQGIADPDKVAIYGGSYGGYAALAGVTFTPDTYAAAISIVGPSNLLTLLESIPPYWESFRKQMYIRMADPNTKQGTALLKKQSPLFSADKIRTPLMVVQGANDPRVKQAESDQIVVAMRELGLPVEYLIAQDEGHGFRKPLNRLAQVAAAEAFFAKHLGGRYQKDMSQEVKDKLAELTVDINEVSLPEALDFTKGDLKMAKPMLMPSMEGNFEYAAHFEMGGNKMPMEASRQISIEGEHVIISDVAKTPMGDISDVTKLNKSTYMPLNREVNQGPVSMKIEFVDGKAQGLMSMNGQNQRIDIDLEGEVYTDGGSMELLIASLPLEADYKSYLKIFNLQKQKVENCQVEVTAVETIEVPAGSFETYKVEFKGADASPGGATYWVDTKQRITIKTKAINPEMGGAIYTAELSKMDAGVAGK